MLLFPLHLFQIFRHQQYSNNNLLYSVLVTEMNSVVFGNVFSEPCLDSCKKYLAALPKPKGAPQLLLEAKHECFSSTAASCQLRTTYCSSVTDTQTILCWYYLI